MQSDSPPHFSYKDRNGSPDWAVTKRPQHQSQPIEIPPSAPKPDKGGGTSVDAHYMRLKNRYYRLVLPEDAMGTNSSGDIGFVPPHLMAYRNGSI
jgi:hypothetical protein